MRDVTDAAQTVGANLRRLRLVRGLPLVELGRLSGLAKGTLTQLEAGRANPTIETLQALAHALGAGLGDLVAEPPPSPVEVVRAHEGPRVPGRELAARLVHRAHLGSTIAECYALELAAGMLQHAGSHAPGVVEEMYVLSGVVEIGPVDATVVLREHDFARFAADQPHLVAAPEGDARALSWLLFPAVPASATSLPRDLAQSAMVGSMQPLAAPAAVREPPEPPVPHALPPRPLPQPPVRGRRPASRTPGPVGGRPKPPGSGR